MVCHLSKKNEKFLEVCIECGKKEYFGEEINGDFACEDCIERLDDEARDRAVDSGIAHMREDD